MTRDSAISRSVLSAQVKERLLEAILDGRYPPGARIVEPRVARELGTSQAPVREALRDLEALGVVETTAFRGARVRRPSAAELLEAFEIRAELESLSAPLPPTAPRQRAAQPGDRDRGVSGMTIALRKEPMNDQLQLSEQMSAGSASLRVDVHGSEPREHVLDDLSFLNYRLADVRISPVVAPSRPRTVWPPERRQ